MGRDRDPYERTLDVLRRRLRAGAFGHGQPLQILKLAADMDVSSTPVREALARLAGEGLIERGPTGYRTPQHDSASLRELYHLDETYALAAVALGRRSELRRDHSHGSPEGGGAGGGDHAERTEALLERVGGIESRALTLARRNLWDRLAPFRRAEPLVFDDLEAEARTLWELSTPEAGPRPALLLRTYFRRRARAAGLILRSSMGRDIN